MLLQMGSAATYTAEREVEAAVTSGQALVKTAANASGGSAVQFGSNAPSPPHNLVAYTGGDSVALRWDTALEHRLRDDLKQFEVYRDGTLIKTVVADSNPDFLETNGMGTVDLAVTKGATYNYQVRTVIKSGGFSSLSQPLTVTHPVNSFPTPTITVDTSRATDLADYVNTKLVPYMRIWYPKMVIATATPNFTPTSSFKVELNTNSPGGNAVAGFAFYRFVSGEITLVINPNYLRNNQVSTDAMLMMNRVIQARANPSSPQPWVMYSSAYWAMYSMQRNSGMVYAAQAGQRYDEEYQSTAQFMEFVRTRYSPNIVKLVQASIMSNAYTDDLFVQQTGRTLAQLQAEWQPTPPKGPLPLRFSQYSNKCIDNNADGLKTDSRAQIWDCNGGAQQQWLAFTQPDGAYALRSANNCLNAQSDGKVAMSRCRGSSTSVWRQAADGSFISQAFNPVMKGKCIETPDGNQANGTWLTLAPCDGSAKQRFTLIP
jgi:hypothetical protein